ncbi:MAG: hypothetical protein HZR80_00820 [Candidatus Heimdallarchaeota archaeon]
MSYFSNIGMITLFLSLAFIFPGLVFVVVFFIYFPCLTTILVAWIPSLNESPFLIVFMAIVGGLLLTSICFSIELTIRWSFRKIFRNFKKNENGKKIEKNNFLFTKGRARFFPDMNISKILANEKDNGDESNKIYINQLTGQAVMHLNIFLGILILWIVFIILYFIGIEVSSKSWFRIRVFIGLILIISNTLVSNHFHNEVRKLAGGKKKARN